MDSVTPRLDTIQSIELAEGVEVRLRAAGPFLRAGAVLIDWGVQFAILAGLYIVAMILGMAAGDGVSRGVSSLVLFFLTWWFPVFFECGKHGATPGKRAMGLRVVQTSGSPITFGQAVLRNFLKFIDGCPALVITGFPFPIPTMAAGLASCLATRRFQRLGDLAAGTVVVYDRVVQDPVIQAPPPMEPVAPRAVLRPDEVQAVTAFRERAFLWSEGRRAEIADHAAELTGAKGSAGATRLMAIGHWLQQRR